MIPILDLNILILAIFKKQQSIIPNQITNPNKPCSDNNKNIAIEDNKIKVFQMSR